MGPQPSASYPATATKQCLLATAVQRARTSHHAGEHRIAPWNQLSANTGTVDILNPSLETVTQLK